uniref:Rh family B glycoprotein n=1 Tax=Strigops habroptila TaxID=2489341 RepID=A0A672UWE1_STRHB
TRLPFALLRLVAACPCCLQTHPSASPPPGFRDVHLQALLGFGFLVAFLSRYGPGSVAISILVVAFAIQWAVLLQGFLHQFRNGKIHMGVQSMVRADFCAAATLISTGAVVGRVNPAQMLLLALLGVTLFTLNEHILLATRKGDSGGSVTVHTFGAYFGLMVSRILPQLHMDQREEHIQTCLFPFPTGTICLWIFWPSFTSTTTAQGSAEPWAVLNTYFSLAASTMATFILSPILCEESTPRMVGPLLIQDAAVAAVAVMGMAGEMLVTPFGALIAGFLAGLIPPLGFRFLTPVLCSRLKIQDTCGVHNVHGLPGMLGAFLGTRTGTAQALHQLSALPLTLLLATLGGCLTGELCLGWDGAEGAEVGAAPGAGGTGPGAVPRLGAARRCR